MEKLTIDCFHKKKMFNIFLKDLNGFISRDILLEQSGIYIKRKENFVENKKLNNYIIEYEKKMISSMIFINYK